MKGKARKPLSSQKGHITREKIIQLQMEQEAIRTEADEIERPPVWLVDKEARKEWRRVVPQLKEIGVVGNLDLANIAGYCNAYAQYRYYTEEIKRIRTLERPLSDDELKVIGTASNLQIKYAQELRRFADMCGMSISSRLKAAAEKTNKTEDRIQSEFGAI